MGQWLVKRWRLEATVSEIAVKRLKDIIVNDIFHMLYFYRW